MGAAGVGQRANRPGPVRKRQSRSSAPPLRIQLQSLWDQPTLAQPEVPVPSGRDPG